jgi:threonine aldolase
MRSFNRRDFLRLSGATAIPAFLPAGHLLAADSVTQNEEKQPVVQFYSDGESLPPMDYISRLQEIGRANPIERDIYGNGGAVAALEKKFAAITGKEKAIFMPTGTMANQLAIAVLSGNNTKVLLQETSHVYRDEADAAQSVHSKRLIPLAKGETYFTAAQLEEMLNYLDREEVFRSGLGCVSVENPVRRADGRMVPLSEIKKISALCREKNIPLHLDGARIHLASAWSGIPVKEYAAYFDSVYISLYKYLGAASGAILCGSEKMIAQMPHYIKVYGGTMYGNWSNAAMALDKLNQIDDKLAATVKSANELAAQLSKLPGVSLRALDGGTNIYELKLDAGIDGVKMGAMLATEYQVRIPKPNANNYSLLSMNETLLYRDINSLVKNFREAVSKSGK